MHGHAHDHAHHPELQHHFTTMSQQREAVTLGMWVFLLTEVLFFGGLFITYTLYRIWYYDAFALASKSIEIMPGLINTVVLIGSSLTMAMSVRSAQTNQRSATVNWLIATIILGSVLKVSMVSLPSVSESSFSVVRSLPPRNNVLSILPIMVSAWSL